MSDVLQIIQALRDRLWSEHGDALALEYTQDEKHLTYYAGDLLARRGFLWFRSAGVEGACYTEKAMHAAFIAGLRLGAKEADQIAERIIADRMNEATAALKGITR